MAPSGCALCADLGGELLWQDDVCRVIRVGGEEGERFPGFCRVIWQAHVAEMSDLDTAERQRLMNVVHAVELSLRQLLQPDKINLANLGNVVPHLHWHIIPRWRDDSHFPAPIWAAAQRASPPRQAPSTTSLRAALVEYLAEGKPLA